VEAAIERVEALNPLLNAVVTPIFDSALDAARAEPAGPFAGVPYLLKDLACEMEGVRFTEGSRFLSGNVSAFDQELVVRLRKAGLVILGKTNTPEFGMAPACEPVLFGPTRNPWDTERSTSGSSGGSAAAVASGMVPFAHGNDLGGSLRYPASACGLFALKPTRARNPLGPEYGDVAGGTAAEHALTRTVRDSAALLDATSGPALGDPYWAPPPARPFEREVGADPGRLRIAFTPRWRPRPPRLRRRRRARGAAVRVARSRGRRGRLAGLHPRDRRGHRHHDHRRYLVDTPLLDPPPGPGARGR
jgi:amidase